MIQSGEIYWAAGVPRRGDGGFNSPYLWYLDPADVRFQLHTIEQCQTSAGDFRGDELEYWIGYGYMCLAARVEAREH